MIGVAIAAGIIGFVLPTMLEPELAMLPWAVGALALSGPPDPPAERSNADSSAAATSAGVSS